ncbi:hypothetical protein [Krasilnikovia sp. M28-CT-15]|uniref:hypothetical protein n=1 Tax=Krasilnikovia sp. M28-CT-15 TaxID=3373540 RepID=UPI00399C95C7
MLDEYNGRPSLLVIEIDNGPVLAWMLQGAGDQYQYWLYVPLSEDELGSLYKADLTMLAEWTLQLEGRGSYVGLAEDGVLVLVAPWAIPQVEPDFLINAVAEALLQELRLTLESDLPEKTGRELRRAPLALT